MNAQEQRLIGLREKECIICNSRFKPKNGKQKTCSDLCSIKLHRKRNYVRYHSNIERECQKAKERYNNDKSGKLKQNKKWVNNHKDKVKNYIKIWNCRNPEKARAHQKINRDNVAGKIPRIRTLKCSICGNPARVYHHPDYNKKAFVVALCYKCHKEVHKNGC